MTPESIEALDETSVVYGSDNIFADLGLPEPELCLTKADLAIGIREIIRDRKWTQRRAASVLGIAESNMSDLMRAKLDRFSLDRLTQFVQALGYDVELRVRPRADARTGAKMRVVFEAGSANIDQPNATTRKAMRDAANGRGLTHATDANDLFTKLNARKSSAPRRSKRQSSTGARPAASHRAPRPAH